MQLSESTIKRKIWQDQAIACLRDYRPPHAPIKAHEILALMKQFDAGLIPADAAEIVQAEEFPMTRDEILERMRSRDPRQLFSTMELGGNVRQLSKLEAEGLIRSQSRRRTGRQRDWYMTEGQWQEKFKINFDVARQEVVSVEKDPPRR